MPRETARKTAPRQAERPQKNQAAIDMLRRWRAEPVDPAEVRAWEQAKQAIDAARSPEHRLFIG